MKKRIGVITTFATLILCMSASAESVLEKTLTVDQTTNTVEVSVKVTENAGGAAVTGLVKNAEDAIVYAAQGFTDENGEFSFSYINKDANGNYDLTVAAPRLGLFASEHFQMLTNSMKETIADSEKTSAGMQSVIENYGEYMNLDMTEFATLEKPGEVYAFMAKDAMIDLDDIDSVMDGFYGAVIVRSLAENPSNAQYQAFLGDETYSILNTDLVPIGKEDDLFTEASDSLKAGILAQVASYPYKSVSELSQMLAFYTLEQSLKNAAQWTEVKPILKKYQEAELLDIDFKEYNKLASPQKADAAMMKKDFADYAAIETAFEKAVEAAKQKKNTSSGGGGGGGYNIGSGIVVEAVKVPEPVEKANETVKKLFTDMENHLWANEAVSYLVEQEIISGMGDGTFAPDKGLTREEISTILVRTRKIATEGKASAFIDVPQDKWSYPYVSAVFAEGLMVGVSEDMFNATTQINRFEYAAIMKRLVDLYGVTLVENNNPGEYQDAEEIPEWAYESVRYLKATGLMLGNTADTFDGDLIVTRAYACDILYRVLTAIGYNAEV
ncbi:MAG: hypothetical protein E7397_04660 [Ruminococcaceae bacterium]|nr:hypothetical protein [Oscillospiraceae bacterium]